MTTFIEAAVAAGVDLDDDEALFGFAVTHFDLLPAEIQAAMRDRLQIDFEIWLVDEAGHPIPEVTATAVRPRDTIRMHRRDGQWLVELEDLARVFGLSLADTMRAVDLVHVEIPGGPRQ